MRRHFCYREQAPLLVPAVSSQTGEEEALASVLELTPSWTDDLDATNLMAEADGPVLLRRRWKGGIGWSWPRLRHLLAGQVLTGVIDTTEHQYLPPDATAAMAPLLTSIGTARFGAQRVHNRSAESVIDELEAAAARCPDEDDRCASREARLSRRRVWRAAGRRSTVHFDAVPEAVRRALQPQEALYASEFDAEQGLQYAWLSTPGMRTHTHFDADRNIFAQLIGRKRFVLWAPEQTLQLCPFPRLHPLWHKSRADFEAPDLTQAVCANYSASKALAVDLWPGDVLYVPSFWWHTVETVASAPTHTCMHALTHALLIDTFPCHTSIATRPCHALLPLLLATPSFRSTPLASHSHPMRKIQTRCITFTGHGVALDLHPLPLAAALQPS